MTTINAHVTRGTGTILTAAIYNFDHNNHVTNAINLNDDKLERSGAVTPGNSAVWIDDDTLADGGPAASGDVTGPAGGVVEAEFAQFDGTTGKVIQGSGKLIATDANVRAAAASGLVETNLIESASAGVALTDAAPVAVDWDAGINFTLTVTANRQIGNPTNGQPGTWRTIMVQGNDATDRVITFNTQFLGEVPTIVDCDNTRWYLLMIFCVSATRFVVSSKRAGP